MKVRLLFFFLFSYYISYSQLVVDFSSDKKIGCGRTAIRFDAEKTIGFTSFHWDFGNGQTNNDELRPLVQYNPGNYTVTLTAYNGQTSLQKTLIINIRKAPTGDIVFVSEGRGCIGETISFKASATAGDASITSYEWVYGDGNKGTGQNSNHVYKYSNAYPGYPLVLEITDANNCSFKTYEYIPISGKSDISIIPNSFYTCDSSSVYFNSKVISDAAIKTYKWDFGDGTTASKSEPGLHKFNAYKKYKISLEATDINGCTNKADTTIALFNVKASIDLPDSVCSGDSITLKNVASDAKFFKWVINSTDIITAETYKMATTAMDSLYIWLRAGNEYCNVFDSAVIKVSSIQSQFKMDTTWVCKFPFEVKFTDNTAGNVKKYAWDFGDGQTSLAKNPKHIFNSPSVIKLKVTSNAGCTSEASSIFEVKRPKPVIILSDSGGCVPMSIDFIADSSKAISYITDYKWEVFNGLWISKSKQTTFTYTNSIKDNVKLTITDHLCGNETDSFMFEGSTISTIPTPTIQNPDTCLIIGDYNPLNPDINPNFKWKKYSYSREIESITPYVDTAYYDYSTSSFETFKKIPLPGDIIIMSPEKNISACVNPAGNAVIMQGPVADIIDVSKTSCQKPTEINLKYKIYDAYKLNYQFENLKGGTGISNSIVFAKDTTIDGTITVTLQQGFYKLHITAHNLKNKKSHTITYHQWNCPGRSGDLTCEKADIIIPVSDKVKADFVTDGSITCWNKLVTLDASASKNAVLHEWYKSKDGETPVKMHPYYTPSLTKGEPLICAANPNLCSLSALYSGNYSHSCEMYANQFPVDSTKTNLLFCNRGLYDIILVSTAADGCSDTLRKNNLIKVFKPEAILTSNNATVCKGDEITFSLQNIFEDTTITSYNLYFGDGKSYKLTSSSELVKKTYDGGKFFPLLILYDALNCGNSIIHQTIQNGNWLFSYVVTSDPHISITTEGTSCQGHSLFVSADSGFVSYSWDFGDGYIENNSTSKINHIYTNAGSFPFSLTAKDTANCPVTVNQTMNVVTTPIFKISVDTPYWGCPIAILSIDDISGNQNIIDRTWEMINSSVNVNSPIIATPASSIVMPVIYPGKYDISLQTNSKYCGISSETFKNVFRMNGSFMKMLPLNDKYCLSDSLLFKPDPASFFNNPIFTKWNFNNIDNSKTVFSDSIVTKRLFAEPGNYNVTLFYSDTLGCEMTDSSSFNINSLKAGFNLPEPICSIPKTIELINLSQGYDSLVWKMGNKVSNIKNYRDTLYSYGKYPVTLEIFNKIGCYGIIKKIIAANPLPFGIHNQQDTLMCAGDTIRLRAFFDRAYLYNWSPQMDIENSDTYNPAVFPRENSTYTVHITDTASRCTTSDSINVFVQGIPEISYDYYYLPYGSNKIFSLSNTNTIRVSLGDSIRFLLTANQPAITYTWENNDNLLTCLNCQNPVARVMKQSIVRVTLTDSLSCYSSLLQREFELIPVGGQILMPTAFSPNGDLINDVVKVLGPGLEKLYYFRIYNYLGNLVFETTILSEGWDGSFNGKAQPSGIYFYKIKAAIYNEAKEYELEGSIKMIR